jgi:hypothetical protein
MDIKELPGDAYSKKMEARGLDVCPIKMAIWDKFIYFIFGKFGRTHTKDEVLAMINEPNKTGYSPESHLPLNR